MKKQIVAIHGGDAHNSHKEYIDSLMSELVERDDFKVNNDRSRRWKEGLGKELGKHFEVFNPEMPGSRWSGKYSEWKIWFDKILPFLHKNPVFIGHSLGGIFLARYFAENNDTKKAAGVFLVAAPYRDKDSDDKLADFVLPKNLARLKKLGDRLHLYHSKDDPIVSFKALKEYTKRLPEAQVTIFKDKGHFILPRFPEIVKEIKRLYE